MSSIKLQRWECVKVLNKKIVALCKKENKVHMLRGKDVDWLGNCVGYYPQIDMPEFTEKTFCTAFDITPKAAGKIQFDFAGEIPEGYDFSDCTEDEVECYYHEDMAIQYGGRVLMPVRTSDGITYLDKAYLAPVANDDLLHIFERHSKSGVLYFAIKIGFMVTAIIMPYNAITEDFGKSLSLLAELTAVKLENMKNAKQHEEQ